MKRWIIGILLLLSCPFAFAADEQVIRGDLTVQGTLTAETGMVSSGALDVDGVLTVSPDGTNEVLQVNDGTIDFTDGNAGTTGTLTIDSSGNWSYNKNIVSTGNVAGATYTSDNSVSDAELKYINTLSSNAQDQLDARCLESVFGTAIGTGLTLDGTTLKTQAALQSIAGLTETNGGLPYGTADNTYAWLAAGAEGALLMGNGAGAPSWLAAGATTEILVGGGAGSAPVWTTATGTGAPARAGSPTFTTQITTPKVLGGTATTQDLDFQTTSGVGEAGADMHFKVGSNGGTEAMTILNDGKVGIGTTAPAAKLEITSGGETIRMSRATFNSWSLYLSTPVLTQGFGLYENTAAAYRLFVGEGGNVGIGTTSPSSNLTVSGLEGAAGTINIWADDGDDTADKIAMSMSTGGVFSIQPAVDSTTKIQILDTDGGTPIVNVDTTNERVGIGTATPAVALDVSGNARASSGILFGTDTAAANMLDDYEEGTYEPTLTCSTSGSYSFDVSANALAYTKVGRTVHIQGRVCVTGESSPVGNLRLSLPFTSANLTAEAGIVSGVLTLQLNGTTIAGDKRVALSENVSFVTLIAMGDDGVEDIIDKDQVDTDFYIYINFTFIAA